MGGLILFLAAQASPPKVGVLDLDAVMEGYREAQGAKEELDRFRVQWELGRDSLKAVLDSLTRDYETKKPMLTDDERVAAEDRIAEVKEELERYTIRMMQALDAKAKELMAPYIAKVDSVVDRIAKEMGLDVVLDVSAGVIWWTPTVDITQLVLTELNQEYAEAELPQKKRLAVFPFREINDDAKMANLGTKIQSYMAKTFGGSPRFRVAEASSINQALETKGITTETITLDQCIQTAVDLGADLLVYGTVSQTGEYAEFEAGLYLADGTAIYKLKKRVRAQDIQLSVEAQNAANTLVNQYISWLAKQE